MDIRLKAAGSVAGVLAVCFSVIWAINYFFPQQALLIMTVGLVAYMAWVLYGITLNQMRWDQEKNSQKTDQ